jgi:hypothetical protein
MKKRMKKSYWNLKQKAGVQVAFGNGKRVELASKKVVKNQKVVKN